MDFCCSRVPPLMPASSSLLPSQTSLSPLPSSQGRTSTAAPPNRQFHHPLAPKAPLYTHPPHNLSIPPTHVHIHHIRGEITPRRTACMRALHIHIILKTLAKPRASGTPPDTTKRHWTTVTVAVARAAVRFQVCRVVIVYGTAIHGPSSPQPWQTT